MSASLNGWDINIVAVVLVAEIVQHFRPKLIQMHNYTAASAVSIKKDNWTVLNRYRARSPPSALFVSVRSIASWSFLYIHHLGSPTETVQNVKGSSLGTVPNSMDNPTCILYTCSLIVYFVILKGGPQMMNVPYCCVIQSVSVVLVIYSLQRCSNLKTDWKSAYLCEL